MLMLSELITSWMRTSQVTLFVHSFTLPRIAEWLCSSMIPGATCLPVASTTTALLPAARCLPTAAIFPFLTSRSVPSRMPAGPDVHTVAFRISTSPGSAGLAMRQASVLPITAGTVTGGSGFFGGFCSPGLGEPVTSCAPTFGTVSVPVRASFFAVRSKSSAGSEPCCTVKRSRAPSTRTSRALSVSAATTSRAVVSGSVLTNSACGPWPQSTFQSPLGVVSSFVTS